MGWWRLDSSDAGPGAPPSLSHLASALASGLLGFRLFAFLAIMHAIWVAEEPAATENGAPCRPRQSDVAGGVEGGKLLWLMYNKSNLHARFH
jgi:hypothetical protein